MCIICGSPATADSDVCRPCGLVESLILERLYLK